MNRYPMTAYPHRNMLVIPVVIPKPTVITVVLCSAASSVILNRLWMTSTSTPRITTNRKRCMMLTPLVGEIPPHIRRMMMIYGGLGYGAPHLRWGGGVIYFCEVVCVALNVYPN